MQLRPRTTLLCCLVTDFANVFLDYIAKLLRTYSTMLMMKQPALGLATRRLVACLRSLWLSLREREEYAGRVSDAGPLLGRDTQVPHDRALEPPGEGENRFHASV